MPAVGRVGARGRGPTKAPATGFCIIYYNGVVCILNNKDQKWDFFCIFFFECYASPGQK